MTVTVRPYARSPYGKSALYTPMRSRDFTTPRGVHGKIDLTVPGGGTSSLSGAGRVAREGEDARRDLGSRYRMLVGGRVVGVYLVRS